MTKKQNNESNRTNPDELKDSAFTDLIFQLQIEKYHSLISILSELRTKAGIFLAMLGVIASLGFSFSAYGVINQYLNIAAANQSINIITGDISAGGVAGTLASDNSQAYVNNPNIINSDITSSFVSINNNFSADGLSTLQTHLGVVLFFLILGLLIITICYVYLLHKSLEIKNLLSPLSDCISQLQNAYDKSAYQRIARNQLTKRLSELEDTVSFFRKQFKKLDKLVIAFCVIGITAIMCLNIDPIGIYIAGILVGFILIWAGVIASKLYREKETIRKWT